MSYEKQQTPEAQKEEGVDFGLLIALGLVFGAGAGTALGNTGLGAGLGLLVATIINAYDETKRDEPGAKTALGIALVALLVFILIFVVL